MALKHIAVIGMVCGIAGCGSSSSTSTPAQTVTATVTQQTPATQAPATSTQAPAATSTEAHTANTTQAPASTSSDSGGGSQTVPTGLVNQPLDVAESDLDSKGITYHVLGGGTFGVVAKGNWGVCSTRPSAGQPVPSAGIGLVVGHFKCGVS